MFFIHSHMHRYIGTFYVRLLKIMEYLHSTCMYKNIKFDYLE